MALIACCFSAPALAHFRIEVEILKEMQAAVQSLPCAGILTEPHKEQLHRSKTKFGTLTFALLSHVFHLKSHPIFGKQHRWYASFSKRKERTDKNTRTVTETQKQFPIRTQIAHTWIYPYPQDWVELSGEAPKRRGSKNQIFWRVYNDGSIVAKVQSENFGTINTYHMKSFSLVRFNGRFEFEILFHSPTRKLKPRTESESFIAPIKLRLSFRKNGRPLSIEFHSYEDDSVVVTKLWNFHSGL